ncbi:MAG: outer membrane protein assembly factor BamE [Bacteroides sp.]|nr:outer membrane protein assembly factor BamE [Bacteroides sp.]
MKKISVFLALPLVLLLTGCSICRGFDYRRLSRIERGMNFDQVCAILGTPQYRDLNSDGEAWTFRAPALGGSSVVKVWFKDGRLDEMKSYLETTQQSATLRDVSSASESSKSSATNSDTKIIVSSDGKHYIKTGSLLITPEGKHIHLP